MTVEPKEIVVYQDVSGRSPYDEWYNSLKDKQAKLVILKRINRLAYGNLGDCNALKDGVFELRLHYGPGYRIYFAQEEQQIILLLLGGDKSSQKQDIQKAKEYYHDYQTASSNNPL